MSRARAVHLGNLEPIRLPRKRASDQSRHLLIVASAIILGFATAMSLIAVRTSFHPAHYRVGPALLDTAHRKDFADRMRIQSLTGPLMGGATSSGRAAEANDASDLTALQGLAPLPADRWTHDSPGCWTYPQQ